MPRESSRLLAGQIPCYFEQTVGQLNSGIGVTYIEQVCCGATSKPKKVRLWGPPAVYLLSSIRVCSGHTAAPATPLGACDPSSGCAATREKPSRAQLTQMSAGHSLCHHPPGPATIIRGAPCRRGVAQCQRRGPDRPDRGGELSWRRWARGLGEARLRGTGRAEAVAACGLPVKRLCFSWWPGVALQVLAEPRRRVRGER